MHVSCCSPLTAIQYVTHFRFVDDVVFSHNGANGPDSKTTRMLRPVRQVAAPGRSLRLRLHLVIIVSNKHSNHLRLLCYVCFCFELIMSLCCYWRRMQSFCSFWWYCNPFRNARVTNKGEHRSISPNLILKLVAMVASLERSKLGLRSNTYHMVKIW